MRDSEAKATISVCITTHRHEAFIEACVRSVLAQAGDLNIEVLVGEDASPDGTREILRALAREDARVKLVLRDRNVGPCANLSGLVAVAEGEFIAHLDGDDIWFPGKLVAQLEVLRDDASIVACYSNALVVAADGTELGVFNRGLPCRIDLESLLANGNRLCHSSLIYRASARAAVTGNSTEFIDYRVHLRLLQYGRLAYIDRPLTGYRWRTPGSMISAVPNAVITGHLDVYAEALGSGASAAQIRRAAAPFWGKVVVGGALRGDLSAARRTAVCLMALPGARINIGWLLLQTIAALPRGLRSLASRSLGSRVFFP